MEQPHHSVPLLYCPTRTPNMSPTSTEYVSSGNRGIRENRWHYGKRDWTKRRLETSEEMQGSFELVPGPSSLIYARTSVLMPAGQKSQTWHSADKPSGGRPTDDIYICLNPSLSFMYTHTLSLSLPHVYTHVLILSLSGRVYDFRTWLMVHRSSQINIFLWEMRNKVGVKSRNNVHGTSLIWDSHLSVGKAK